MSRIANQVARNSAVPMDCSGAKGLIVPSGEVADGGRAIPDLTFAPEGLSLFREADSWMPAAGVALVVEVTSSRADRDRDAKRRAYAGAGIPLYLLVDRDLNTIILFSDPAGGDYRRTVSAVPGDQLDLPKPFEFALETAPFAG